MVAIGAFSDAATRQVSKASATDFFGGGTAQSVFSVGVGGGATDGQQASKVIIASQETEINRIRGYKLKLTPSETEQLRQIRADVIELNEKAGNATATEEDLDKRKELLAEADVILGKPSADVEADDILATLREKINDVLSPELSNPTQRRVDILEKLKANFEKQITRNPSNKQPQLQLQNVARQILTLTPLTHISQLSSADRKEYDQLVELTNKHVGEKLVLSARESIRVADLQTSINELKASLPADSGSGPSPADVSRAYVRLS